MFQGDYMEHTPMNIDENGTYNIQHKIYTDEYRWDDEHTTMKRRISMRQGTYNDQFYQYFMMVFISSKNLEPIKLISFTNVSLVKIYYRYQ